MTPSAAVTKTLLHLMTDVLYAHAMSSSPAPASDVLTKRVRVEGASVAPLIAALAKAEGIAVVDDGPADLVIIEASEPEALVDVELTDDAPLLCVSPRRLRSSDRQRLRDAGATRILDVEATFLDIAFAFSELLFETFDEQRRYGRRVGGLAVQFHSGDAEVAASGRLVGIARSGAFIHTPHAVDEGTTIELELELGDRLAPVRGRVAFVDDDGFGVEFALDDRSVAPRLYALC